MSNKFYKKEKGITLIALVITIIVLLLLAGISINTLSGEEGILTKAAGAKSNTEEESTKESIKLGVMSALTDGLGKIKEASVLETALKEQGLKLTGNVEENKDEVYTATINNKNYVITAKGEIVSVETDVKKLTVKLSEKTIFEDVTSDNQRAVIPEGFKISGDSQEQSIDDGLVVIASDGSEFVWIPVDDITTMYGKNLDGRKIGKLYSFSLDGTTTAYNWTETSGVMSWISENGNKEPVVLYDENTNVNDSSNGVILTALQSEFDEMIKYVGESNGFYVGRYETSFNEEGNAQSVKNVTSDTTNTWYGLYEKQKLYGDDKVGSSMIWGSQYDQMMIWMAKNGYTVASETPKEGIIYNDTETTGKEGNQDVMNNVNDLLGCKMEWTIETMGPNGRQYRGGSASASGSAVHRSSMWPPYPYYSGYVSTRLALYVK